MDFIIQILNLLYLIFIYLRLYLLFKIPLFYTFKNDSERIKNINYIFDNTFNMLNNLFKNRILINGSIKKLDKITIINYNHVHNADNLIGWIVFYLNKIRPYEISSISTFNDISNFDENILNIYESININKLNIFEEIVNKINFFSKKCYNRYVMCFFEGITLNHSKQKSYYKYLNKPKYLSFEILCSKFKKKKFYDIDIVYTYKNRWINPKDKYFIWKLLHPKCKIYVNIQKYTFPENNEREYLDKLYLNKNKNIMCILNRIK